MPSFPLSSSLPPELRIQIWHHALPKKTRTKTTFYHYHKGCWAISRSPLDERNPNDIPLIFRHEYWTRFRSRFRCFLLTVKRGKSRLDGYARRASRYASTTKPSAIHSCAHSTPNTTHSTSHSPENIPSSTAPWTPENTPPSQMVISPTRRDLTILLCQTSRCGWFIV